jgi:diaminohydroxyphosphoribosylaminopyrimidine deaminase/5-amino-6-(5-phosphoribosylamino)uracil reductase
MLRCLQLAALGAGSVTPNPMVGSVLVYADKIIGEGFHQKYGEPHAEVNCINNVKEIDKPFIKKSSLYVSLEPCNHFGKTPPCTDLILENKIPKVVIGCIDVYKEVAGKGILKLQKAGVEVVSGVLEKECTELNKRFFTFHQKFRPYIILKWAQSVNGKTGAADRRVLISNEYTNRIVHKWRSEESAILVGTNTVLQDDPYLTNRLWRGKNPVRIIIDKNLKLQPSLKIFNTDSKTIIFNLLQDSVKENVAYIKLRKENFLNDLMHSLFENNIQSVIIEGGAKTLQSFIDKDLWDEARVITNEELIIENGISAPEMKNFISLKQQRNTGDLINYYLHGS